MYFKQADRMLAPAPGPVSYALLERVLGRGLSRKDARRCVHFSVSKARRQLSTGESIENVRNLGYQLVRNYPRAA